MIINEAAKSGKRPGAGLVGRDHGLARAGFDLGDGIHRRQSRAGNKDRLGFAVIDGFGCSDDRRHGNTRHVPIILDPETLCACHHEPVISEMPDHRLRSGEGMLCAVEFVEDRDTRRFFDPERKVGPSVAAALLEQGVIARAMPQGDILGFAPPLCLTGEEADIIVERTRTAVTKVLG